MHPAGALGITTRFQELSPTIRQVSHALLTRSPLSPPNKSPVDPVRLACVKHAASVRPEPESNPPHKNRRKPNTGPQKNKINEQNHTPPQKQSAASHKQTPTPPPPTKRAQAFYWQSKTQPKTTPHKKGTAFNQTTTYKTYKHKSSTKHALEFSNHHHTHQNTPPHRKHTPTGSNKKQYTPHPTPHNPGVSHTTHTKTTTCYLRIMPRPASCTRLHV